MTLHEFKQLIRRKNTFDRYWYYGASWLTIGGGLFLLVFPFVRPEFFSVSRIHFALCGILMAIGAYALYKLPNRFKVVTVPSTRSLSEKKEALEQVAAHFGCMVTWRESNYLHFIYKQGFWYGAFMVHLFYDPEQVGFSVQGESSGRGGFIDLGGTERLRTRIKDEIELLLA